MAHQKIIDSVKKQGQVTIKDLDEFLQQYILQKIAAIRSCNKLHYRKEVKGQFFP